MRQKVNWIKKVPIRIDFEDVEADKFKTVKKFMGLKQNTEVIRALLTEKFHEIQLLEQRRHAQLERETKAMDWLEKGEYESPM